MSSASAFINTLGVNTHTFTSSGNYQNSSLMVQALNYLGVNAIRDGFTASGLPAQVIDALADAGIRINALVASDLPEKGEAALAGFVTALEKFVTSHSASIISVEGLNEANVFAFSYNGSSSLEAAAAFQKALYTSVHASGIVGDLPVLNMTLGHYDPQSYAKLGDLSAYSDFANVHSYAQTNVAVDTTQEYHISLSQIVNHEDTVVISEMGYTTLESFNAVGVSETAHAKLILNGLLDAFENGVQKTYLYELFDGDTRDTGNSEKHFGLFDSDGAPKPAAVAIHNLTTILSYDDKGDGAPETPLDYSLSGQPGNTHSLVLTKANGAYDLVLWAEPKIWDDVNDRDFDNAASMVTIELGGVYDKIYVYDPLIGKGPIAVYTNTGSITVPLSDHPIIVEIGARSPVTEIIETVAPVLTPSAEQLVAQIDYLTHTQGLESVKLTDGHVLQVSSKATMLYMIEHYQNVLGKITGGYTFSIDVNHDEWQTRTSYDAAGKLTSTITTSLKDGILSASTTVHSDGSSYSERYEGGVLVATSSVSANGDLSHAAYTNGIKTGETINHPGGGYEIFQYGITGQTYITQQQVFDAKGRLQTIERTDADGYSSLTLYDVANGKIVSIVQESVQGTTTKTYTYFADGSRKSLITKTPDGAYETHDYGITGRDYTYQHQTYGSDRKIQLVERTGDDGFWQISRYDPATGKLVSLSQHTASGNDSAYTYASDGTLKTSVFGYADGSSKSYTYASDGSKKTAIIKFASGSYETYDYGVTGTAYTYQHQIFGTDGKILLIERTGKNGYSQTSTFDASTGKLINLTQFDTNGTSSYYTYTSDGVQKSTIVKYADSSYKTYDYNIQGKDYTTQYQLFTADRKILAIERTGDNGFSQIVRYDATTGKMTSFAQQNVNGTYSYQTFKANGDKVSSLLKYADGSYETREYAIAGKDYSYQYQFFGTDSKIRIIERSSDSGFFQTTQYDAKTGKVVSYEQHSANGAYTRSTYTAAGEQISTITKSADGAYQTYDYNIAKASYVTEHKVFDVGGALTLLERLHADGTFAYVEKYQSTQTIYSTFNAAGVVSLTETVKLDGSKISYAYATDGSGDYVYKAFNAAGTITSQTVHDAGVSDTATKYVDGVKSIVTTTYANGYSDWSYYKVGDAGLYLYSHQVFGTDGGLTSMERYDANGTTVYTETRKAGVVSYALFTADGVNTETTVIGVDGVRDSTYFSPSTGLTTHKISAADGTVFLNDIKLASGAHTVTAYSRGLNLNGGVHDDVFTFNKGASGTVNYDGGKDKVYGFDVTVDHIDLADHLVKDLSEVSIYQSGSDTIVFIDAGNSITLKNVALSSTAHDWLLA